VHGNGAASEAFFPHIRGLCVAPFPGGKSSETGSPAAREPWCTGSTCWSRPLEIQGTSEIQNLPSDSRAEALSGDFLQPFARPAQASAAS
jgi:hypothetical protein